MFKSQLGSPLISVLAFSIVLLLVFELNQAAHVHVHEKSGEPHAHEGHAKTHGSKERLEDGWNNQHYKEGQHNDEFDHEAILGNREKAKEFDGLTPEESKRRLRLLVTRDGMDANGDGFVDSAELTNWVVHSFKNLAEEDGIDRFEEEDLDEDGFVTWKEHMKDNFDIEDEATEPVNDIESQKMIAEDRSLWQAADLNSDGKLDRREFPPFNTPEEYEHMSEMLYHLTLIRRDVNGDGFLDIKEFLVDDNGQMPDRSSETYISEKDKFETDYDLNRDGKLDKKEVLLWIVPNNE